MAYLRLEIFGQYLEIGTMPVAEEVEIEETLAALESAGLMVVSVETEEEEPEARIGLGFHLPPRGSDYDEEAV